MALHIKPTSSIRCLRVGPTTRDGLFMSINICMSHVSQSLISLVLRRSSFSEEGGKEREDWEKKGRKKIMVSTRRNGNLSNNSSSNPKRSSHSPESKPSSPKRPKVSLSLNLQNPTKKGGKIRSFFYNLWFSFHGFSFD